MLKTLGALGLGVSFLAIGPGDPVGEIPVRLFCDIHDTVSVTLSPGAAVEMDFRLRPTR